MARMAVKATTPTSATGMRAERGMTLLELLVVLTIIGLLAGLAAAAYGGLGGRQQAQSVARVMGMLLSARQEAMVSGRAVHVQIAAFGGRQSNLARLAWKANAMAGPGSVAPTFYPDGSAAPGVLELTQGPMTQRIEVDWRGGVRHGDSAR
jgi:type II secretion system protein H